MGVDRWTLLFPDLREDEPAGIRRRMQAGGKRERQKLNAGVAELVDALDLGSSGESRGGSDPSARTI